MRHISRHLAFGCALLMTSICAHRSVGRADELRSGVTSLFQLGEKNTPIEVAAARAQYESLIRVFSNSAGLDYTYGLVLINQHQYREAVSLIERYLARYPNDANAVRAKIWAAAHDRQYVSALEDTIRLSRYFANDLRAKPVTERKETAQFLGAVFGYLELARREAVDDKVRREAKSRVLSAIGETYLSAFDRGRQMVADRLASLKDEQQQKRQRAAEIIDNRQEKVEDALKDSGQTIALSQEIIQSGEEKLRNVQRKLNLIQHQLGSLAKDRAQLTVRTIAVQAQLTQLLTPASETIDQTRPGDPRPIITVTTTSFMMERYPQIVALSATLASLNRQAWRMDEKIISLRAEANQLNTRGRRESQTVAANQAAVQKVARRAKALQTQVRRLASRQPKRRGLTAEMKKLSTYLPFPFDEEKQRVLGWFEN